MRSRRPTPPSACAARSSKWTCSPARGRRWYSRLRWSAHKLPPGCEKGYETVKLVEGGLLITTTRGQTMITEPNTVITICANGAFFQGQQVSSILPFTPESLAIAPTGTEIAARAFTVHRGGWLLPNSGESAPGALAARTIRGRDGDVVSPECRTPRNDRRLVRVMRRGGSQEARPRS